uniref:Uncharacterized protein n=1 Tax=Oryza nivara TaxID=4536 RepID=A0A0E0J560_ORYNI
MLAFLTHRPKTQKSKKGDHILLEEVEQGRLYSLGRPAAARLSHRPSPLGDTGGDAPAGARSLKPRGHKDGGDPCLPAGSSREVAGGGVERWGGGDWRCCRRRVEVRG